MLCEKCQKREASIHLTQIGTSAEFTAQHFCESCYAAIQKKSTTIKPEAFQASSNQASKPKLAGAKTKQSKIAAGLWTKCPQCNAMLLGKHLQQNLGVCPQCQYHFGIGARERVASLVEIGSFEELDAGMTSVDPLKLGVQAGYKSKLASSRKQTGEKDAVITGIGKLGEHRVGLGVMDFGFLGGSMGSVVGEKLTRMVEKSTSLALPVIILASSGGARIYEGMFSLMQMAKTSGALALHRGANLPFISVLTNPTMAGVLASFASLGGIIFAEPGAKIGFADPHIITEITQAKLPP
jgi:acetyl-CoA carboxylase carboxyl transferase subunit beta